MEGFLFCEDNYAEISNVNGHCAEVYPSTICQCTGAKDKNGKLIWENDIMQAHLDDQFHKDVTRIRVLWHENGWCTNQYRCDDYEELDCYDEKWFEVVGNMIDNPELLEV